MEPSASPDPFARKGPSHDPFATPPTITWEKPKSPEKREAPKKPRASIAEYEARAKKVESEPNKDAADVIRRLQGTKTTAEQLEGLTALNQALVSVLTKLAKKGVDISKIRTTEQLKREVVINGLQLSIPEAAAIENLDRIASQSGETADEIKKSWPETVDTAKEASKGYGAKYMKHLKSNPVETIALTVAGIAGIYLSYQGIKALAGKAFGGAKNDKDKSSSWFKKEVAIPLVIMAAGGFLGKDAIAKILASYGLDYFGVEDKVKKGQEFTEEEKKKLTDAGEKIRQKVEEEKAKRGGQQPESAEPEKEKAEPAPTEEARKRVSGELFVDGERLTIDEQGRKLRYEATAQALTHLYCIDEEKFRDIRPDISMAFILLSKVPAGKIVDAYDRAKIKKSETISFEELGIPTEPGFHEQALYHTCAIISMAFKEAEKIPKMKVNRTADAETFLGELGNDPALGISHRIQQDVAAKIGELQISSLTELHQSAEKVFETKVIEEMFDKGKGRFDEYTKLLTDKYKIDINSLDEREKASFFAFIGMLYAGGFKLNQSEEAIDHLAGFQSLSPNVKKAGKEFFKALKADIIVLLPQCVARYDIKRPDNTEYDQVLGKYLTMDMLHFKDGLQMALLSDGIGFDQPTEYESVSQAKDITMLYLMVHILKQRSPNKAYPLYLSNLIDLGSKSKIDLKLNINFQKLQPYFNQLFGILFSKSKNWVTKVYRGFMGLTDTHYDKDKVQKLSEMTAWEFSMDTLRSGSRATLGIPVELVQALAGQFPDEVKPQTTGEEVLKMCLSLGGTLSFPVANQAEGLLYLFGKYYFIRPIGTTFDSISALFQKGPGVAAETFLLGTSPYVILGAVGGAKKAWAIHHASGWRTALGGLTGGAKGLLSPINMPVTGYRYMRGAVRQARYFANIHGSVTNFEMSSKLFLKYDALVIKESSGALQKLRALKERPALARKYLWNDVYSSMRLRWAHRAAVNYNDFWGLNPELPAPMDSAIGKTLQGVRYNSKDLYDSAEFIPKLQRTHAIIAKMRGIKDIETLGEAALFDKFAEIGLEHEEISTLKMKAKKLGFEKFRKALVKDLKISAGEAGPGLASRLRARFRRTPAEGGGAEGESAPETTKPASEPEPAKAGTASAEATEGGGRAGKLRRAGQHLLGETLASAGGAEKAFAQAGADLEAVFKKIAVAEKTILDIDEARRTGTLVGDVKKAQEQVDAARQIIADGKRAEAELEAFRASLQGVRQTETALKLARTEGIGNVAKLEGELRAATEAAEGAMKSSGRAMETMTRLGKAGRYLKPGLRIAGTGLAGAGAAFSAYSALSSGYEAVTTDVEGRGTIKGAEAGMWTVNTVADTAVVATMLGAEGAGVTFASTLALPLAPLTYAGAAVFETLNEDTRTSAEWIQGDPYQVINHLYTSMNACSLGNAWLSLTEKAADLRIEKQKETMHKIFRGLVAIQKDPSLLAYIRNTKPSKEKDAEIEKRIAADYTPYHEYFFRNQVISGVQSSASAQKLVLEAQMYDDIMQKRDEAKRRKEPFVLIGNDKRPFSLHLDRYDVLGGVENPKGRIEYNPAAVVQAYKETLVHIFERDPIRKGNLDRMDSAYLVRLYVQIGLTLSDPKVKADQGLAGDLVREAESIAGYLKTARSVNMISALEDPSYREPRMSLEEIGKHLEGIGSVNNAVFRKFEEENYHLTPALRAIYKLGEYFGYAGPPTEKGLKDFFHKEAASYHGVYWDGSGWRLQKRGWDADESYGPALTGETVQQMVRMMREYPDNILEHRSDSIFLDAYDYTYEVKRMADIMEKGLKEG